MRHIIIVFVLATYGLVMQNVEIFWFSILLAGVFFPEIKKYLKNKSEEIK